MQLIILTIASFLSWGQIFLENVEPSLEKQVTSKHRLVLSKLGYNVKPKHLVPEHQLHIILKNKTIILAPCGLRCSKDLNDKVGVIVNSIPNSCSSNLTDHVEVIFVKTGEILNEQITNNSNNSNIK